MTSVRKALRKLRAETERKRETDHEIADSDSENGAVLPSIGMLSEAKDGLIVDATRPQVQIDFAKLCDAGLYPPVDQQREIANEFRLIKRPLIDNVAGTGAYQSDDSNLIMVTSPFPADGKTFSCLNLALSMAAEKDRSILLVDSDVAKPHISEIFDLGNKPGLIDLLLKPELSISDVVVPTDVKNLSLLPAGSEDEHANELLASNRMASIVQMLSGSGSDRIVIFDSPPLLVTSEARVLAKSMGQIVLVVCAGKTSQDAVIDAASSLDMRKPVSVILNQSTQGKSADFYGYGSRRYSGASGTSVRR